MAVSQGMGEGTKIWCVDVTPSFKAAGDARPSVACLPTGEETCQSATDRATCKPPALGASVKAGTAERTERASECVSQCGCTK